MRSITMRYIMVAQQTAQVKIVLSQNLNHLGDAASWVIATLWVEWAIAILVESCCTSTLFILIFVAGSQTVT